MPKGPKKRKAAKKKKEQEEASHSNNGNNPQGNDDPKSHDERESDGEVASPVSQEHHSHHHPFNESNGGSEKSVPSPAQSSVPENKTMESVTVDVEESEQVEQENGNAVKIDREVKSDVDVESKDVTVEHVDSAKESHVEDDRSSSNSSSDSESQTFENKLKEGNNEKKEAGAFSEEARQVPENGKPVQEAISDIVEETVYSADLVTPVVTVSAMAKSMMTSAHTENSDVLEVVESSFEGNEDKLLPTSNEDAGVSSAAMVLEENADKDHPVLDENAGESSNVVGSTADANGNAGKALASPDTHSVETGNGAEKTKDHDTSKCTENQPLLASAPRIAERTSWLNCCGLFDGFGGSNR